MRMQVGYASASILMTVTKSVTFLAGSRNRTIILWTPSAAGLAAASINALSLCQQASGRTLMSFKPGTEFRIWIKQAPADWTSDLRPPSSCR